MNDLYIESGYLSYPHYGELLCGDQVVIKDSLDGKVIGVLADGLGSGVKANILATITSTMLATMMKNQMNIEDCIKTIATTLPVCKERGLAYSTFTLLSFEDSSHLELFQYDNPKLIFLRNGKHIEYSSKVEVIDEKTIMTSTLSLEEDDILILMSDGVTHAGVGRVYNFGWKQSDIIEFIEKKNPLFLSSKVISTLIIDETMRLYENKPYDDVTVCTFKVKKRQQVNLLIGPATHKEDDSGMMSLFFSKSGKHIVCGGTTATIAARYLNEPMNLKLEYSSKEIPPIGEIEGVDLVTEGVITLAKVLEYAKNYISCNDLYTKWKYQYDGASMISEMLFEEATDINFYSGCAVNPAHQNTDLPITFSIKMQLVDELSKCLKQMGKQIKISYF